MALGTCVERTPRVVALGKPEFVDDEYIKDFQQDFAYEVS